MKRRLARCFGLSIGYLFVVLLERIVDQVAAQAAPSAELLERAAAQAAQLAELEEELRESQDDRLWIGGVPA